MRMFVLALTILIGAAGAEDTVSKHPLGALKPVLEASKAPTIKVEVKGDAAHVVGKHAQQGNTLLHDAGRERPITLRLEVALAPGTKNGVGTQGAPSIAGAGLVYGLGRGRYAAFVLMPEGRTAVVLNAIGRPEIRIQTSWAEDSSTPLVLELIHHGTHMTFKVNGNPAGELSTSLVAGAPGEVGVIVFGDTAAVLKGYTELRGEQPADSK